MELTHTNIPPKFYRAVTEEVLDLPRLPNGFLDMAQMPASIAEIFQHNATASPLLRLPSEIRNKIYEAVLTDVEFEVYAFNSIPYRIPKDTTSKYAVSLPCVCRQLYSDTSLLLYSTPTFTFPRFGVETCKKWVETLSPAQIQAVRTVKCWYYMCSHVSTSMFPSLRYLVAMRYTSSSKISEEDLQKIKDAQGSPGVDVSIEYLDD